jgi:hypothetical protein
MVVGFTTTCAIGKNNINVPMVILNQNPPMTGNINIFDRIVP